MAHYPTHMREAFLEWLDAGCPDTATIEIGYEPVEITANNLLRRFFECSDILPRLAIDQVAGHVGFEKMDGLTYGAAAGALLVERYSEGAGQELLEQLAEAH